jgi:AraC family transcriptional regulator
MAIPERLISVPRLIDQAQSHKIFEKTLELEGVKVGHYRVRPGEMLNCIHTTHHVFVPLSGSIIMELETENGTIRRGRRTVGDIGVTPAGLSYSAYWEDELEYVLVFLKQEFITRATSDFEANRNAQIVLACGPPDPLIRSIGAALAAEIESGQPAGKIYAESLVNTLAVHLLRHYSTESVVPDLHFGGLPANKLRRVTDFIDANLESDLTLTEIADSVDLSQYHFARAFKQTTGLTPIQFLMQRRIELAKQLLSESDLPIVEISLQAGFKNQSHFTTLFRKFTMMTPKAYRNAVQH